tara:strand:+ start:322 stop:1326 length:1005 start_codon:yes stop_codon:yes gene_type:complete
MNKILLEYIWIDGDGGLRSKTKVVKSNGFDIENIPQWNYDGSSTKQAEGSDSEVILKPVRCFSDPFRKNENLLVLCEALLPDGSPAKNNTRNEANKIFTKYEDLESMFGIEQEFFIAKDNKVLAFLGDKELEEQNNYYCGVGGNNIYERKVIEEAFQNCLNAGLNLTGLNAEVAPSQWEFQVCAYGIDAADQLIALRYITNRTLEIYGYNMDLHPKPVKGDWNGSGCHVNFSTNKMRDSGGIVYIMEGINNLGKKHNESMEIYGLNNSERLTGKHETSSFDNFSYGVANRGSSVRIPRDSEKNSCGYFEDRRPGSNMDPYLVCSSILNFSQSNA